MESFWTILAWILAVSGIIGALVPVLPGPLLAFGALASWAAAGHVELSTAGWWAWCGAMILVSAIDYILPGWMAKRFGGSRAGMIGATVGAIGGLFFGPLGILIGPFVGAVAGELLQGGRGELNHAVQVGIGSFLAFIVGTGIKLIFALTVVWKML